MKGSWITLLAAFLAAGAVAAAGSAATTNGGLGGGFGPARVVGHVYVNDNTTGTNTVAAFDRHADGTLTPTQGSPFAVGGSGTGAGIASQGALALSSDGRFLLAVDGGSNEISVARVLPNGGLVPVGGPTASNGANPVSVAVHNGLVYVANQGTDTSTGQTNYTGFILDLFGGLHALPGSTVTLPDAAKPGDVLFNADGTRLVGTEIASSAIDSFTIGFFGRLNPAPGSPFSAQGLRPDARVRPARELLQPCQSVAALRLRRPRRGRRPRAGARLELHGRVERRAHADRPIAGQQRRNGVVLGRDQPRRSLSVRREHRLGDDLELLDRIQRSTHVPSERPDQGLGARARGCPPLARRRNPLGRRQRRR